MKQRTHSLQKSIKLKKLAILTDDRFPSISNKENLYRLCRSQKDFRWAWAWAGLMVKGLLCKQEHISSDP